MRLFLLSLPSCMQYVMLTYFILKGKLNHFILELTQGTKRVIYRAPEYYLPPLLTTIFLFRSAHKSQNWYLGLLVNFHKLPFSGSRGIVEHFSANQRSERSSWSWPLTGWEIFYFSSETVERMSTKLYRKQYLKVLYHVCDFRTDQKNKMSAFASGWLRHFRLLLWNCWTEFNETTQEVKFQRLLPSLCIRAHRKNKMTSPVSDWMSHYQLLL